jgi:NADPH:quinone reductase-like Zn-dependent oxidoreductase
MYGFLVEKFGGPEEMQWQELPDPEPGDDQIVMDVMASGVNFAEIRMRAGDYSGQPLPFVMGMEGAGIVSAIGPGVTAYKVGDRVFARARGTHGTKALIDIEHAMHLPNNLSFIEGAAIPVGWQTAWHALMTVGQLQEDQNVLIEAIASSVGSAALQIGKWKNCWVAGTGSRSGKLEKALQYGADAVYNYKTEKIDECVARDTAGKGIDVGLMTIGQETAASLLNSMGMEGKVVMYGSTSGRDVTFSLNIGVFNVQLLSMSISTCPRFMPQTMKSFRDIAVPLFAEGVFKPVVSHVLPMSEVVRAHEMISEREHFGKIILSNE